MRRRLTCHRRAHGIRCFAALYWRAVWRGLLDIDPPLRCRLRFTLPLA